MNDAALADPGRSSFCATSCRESKGRKQRSATAKVESDPGKIVNGCPGFWSAPPVCVSVIWLLRSGLADVFMSISLRTLCWISDSADGPGLTDESARRRGIHGLTASGKTL